MQPYSHNTHGPKNWGLCRSPRALFGVGGSPSNTKSPGHTKWHLHASRHSATINMGLKFEGSAPFLGSGLGPHLTQSRLGRGLAPYQVASGSIQPFGRNRYGPKIGGCTPSPSNTMWPGLRPTCTPSFILICLYVCPQCTNVTNRQTDTDRQTDREGKTMGEDKTMVRQHRANRFTNGRPKIL